MRNPDPDPNSNELTSPFDFNKFLSDIIYIHTHAFYTLRTTKIRPER